MLRGILLFFFLCSIIHLVDLVTAQTSIHPNFFPDQERSPDEGWKPEELIPESYNKLKAPTGVNGSTPCDVKISLNITQILGVKEADESYRVRCILTQTWFDDRIVYPHSEPNNRIFLTPSIVTNLWIPHTFIANSISALNAAEAPVVTWEIHRNKQIFAHSRMFLQLSCSFDLSLFPHDTQICEVLIESQTNTKLSVNYTWSDFNLLHAESARFTMAHESTDYCENTRGSEFSCLRASFAMQRRLGYYVIKVYGPSILIVVTTFLGFWMPIQGLPARTIILVLPLLALVTQQVQVNNEIVVSYVVALHVWFMVCTFFIFMALIELATALIYAQRVADWKDSETLDKQLNESSGSESGSHEAVIPNDIELAEGNYGEALRRHSYGFAKRASIFTIGGDKGNSNKSSAHLIKLLLNQVYGPIDWRKSPQDRNKIDYVARILFPSAFLIFAIFYFTTLNT